MRESAAGVPGVELLVLPAGVTRARVEIDGSREPPPPTPEVEAAWAELARANPRLFSGAILALDGVEIAGGDAVLRCRRDTYMRLAVQPLAATGVEQLSVTGVLTARDGAGREHVLLGRRGPHTRIYGGLWEFGPAGGIDPPAAGVTRLSFEDLLRHLAHELHDETGLDAPILEPRPLALVRDRRAMSTDLFIAARLAAPVEDLPLTGGWEYPEARWLPRDELPALDRPDTVGTTRAVVRHLASRD